MEMMEDDDPLSSSEASRAPALGSKVNPGSPLRQPWVPDFWGGALLIFSDLACAAPDRSSVSCSRSAPRSASCGPRRKLMF